MKSYGVELEDFPENGVTLTLNFKDEEIMVARVADVLTISAASEKNSFVKRYSLLNEQPLGWTLKDGVLEIR